MTMRKRAEDQPDLEAEAPPATIGKASPFSAGKSTDSFDYYDEEDADLLPGWTAHYGGKGKTLMSVLPPLKWVPAYIRAHRGRSTDQDKLEAGGLPYSIGGDTLAGLTVGCMLVPQCLAFALLAGLPVYTGLYASFLPLVIYSVFGTIRQVQPGPTALMSLLTAQALDSLSIETAVERIAGATLLAAMIGGMSIAMGVLRLGFIVDFMSHSVMSAFCSAAGVTIATSQLKHMLGITMPRKKHWWQTAWHLLSHLDEADGPTCSLGFGLLVLMLILKQWKGAGSKEKRSKHWLWRCLPADKTKLSFKSLKFVADMSGILSVTLGLIIGRMFVACGIDSVRMVGDVDAWGLATSIPGDGLQTGFDLGSFAVSAGVMCVVGFLETIAVGGKFANAARYEYDPDQELIALGAANLGAAFTAGYPVTGSFSRTAVNAMLGANSLVACAFSSLLVFLACFVLLPLIALLPYASLAPIIIQGAIGVISVHEFAEAWKATRSEFIVMLLTFVVSLWLTVKEGLLTGFIFSVFKTMHELANPNLAVCGRLPDGNWRDIRNFPRAVMMPNVVVVRMDARLSFANSRKLKEFCLRAVSVRESQGDTIEYLIIDAKSINHVDLTGCECLEALATSLESRKQKLILANLKGPVSKCLAKKHVPEEMKKKGGFLCTDMAQAYEIVSGIDPTGLAGYASVSELVKRVDVARSQQLAATSPSFYQCATAHPKNLCASRSFDEKTTASGSSSPASIGRQRTPQPGECTPKSTPTLGPSPSKEPPPDLALSDLVFPALSSSVIPEAPRDSPFHLDQQEEMGQASVPRSEEDVGHVVAPLRERCSI